jgi:asparagine synthase (glutamine-hydrolysing)
VDRFKGMFAFADRETSVSFARDRLGIKPLYLAETPDACGSPQPCARC